MHQSRPDRPGRTAPPPGSAASRLRFRCSRSWRSRCGRSLVQAWSPARRSRFPWSRCGWSPFRWPRWCPRPLSRRLPFRPGPTRPPPSRGYLTQAYPTRPPRSRACVSSACAFRPARSPDRVPAGRGSRRPGSAGPVSAGPVSAGPASVGPVYPGRVSAGTLRAGQFRSVLGRRAMHLARHLWLRDGGACLPSSSPALGPGSRRCRPADGAVTEPFTAGGPGLVLPRDRDPPGRGRMYRRTRSISRSRISRTPSDRVPGCQGMTKLRERHLSLPAVTGYGCHAVTERLLLFTDELVSAPAKLRACGWSVLYLRCSPWVSGCAGPGGHGGWPGPRVQRRRLPSGGTRRAVGGTPQPMTVCH